MTTDLTMLVWTALLSLVMPVIYVSGRSRAPGGVAWGLGNRDQPLPVEPWIARAVRAHANQVENLAPFAILVLVAQVAGRANGTTALGATIFFWGRVAYVAVYVAGVTPLRTIVFFAAMLGELMILSQIL
jgi:uncharacterized MAPEG superfamily protein